ncbi:MAG: DUF4881 domain-containing protein [Thermodesulfovibrionales bacterium]|nr:DUF4881 domain-containing protein [Thermodesulfovibrionales bacterium]
MKRILTIFFIFTSILLLLGCNVKLGEVDQGRVIEFDKNEWSVVLIQDKNYDQPGNPAYEVLPPHKYFLPKDPAEMGPEPTAGYRMKLDLEKNKIVIFDPTIQNFRAIDIKVIEKKEKIGRDDPLVKGKKFPIIDKEKKTVTVYSSRQKLLSTFQVPDEYINYPEKTWVAGDEVRVYYKEPGKALRFMNITKTDIYKK